MSETVWKMINHTNRFSVSIVEDVASFYPPEIRFSVVVKNFGVGGAVERYHTFDQAVCEAQQQYERLCHKYGG